MYTTTLYTYIDPCGEFFLKSNNIVTIISMRTKIDKYQSNRCFLKYLVTMITVNAKRKSNNCFYKLFRNNIHTEMLKHQSNR